ncbi:DHS-like NAD/FAD-binding domain-containing protein [Anaeromyces robustus]|uniref:DHS-like NAD/FAD-binding domain-containing protein n=1 Tax=Anaeromyces robustus TaxID=1754192 RepID=A0A1Y1XP47_9FUNG|nr:DHS-like NAD/FAD-binding domain-containing protein [Anaeromyces robustus]|eukprot:ORX87445.1 DHS-like NAD/FAD-binding domain-containing protein [Anaeromyces robustus]
MEDQLSRKIESLKKLISDCDCVLIGAGAGLSVAAGLDNKGLKFEEVMKDFIDEYGFTDFYSGGFYPFRTEEEKWAYFARYFVTYLDSKSTELYENIFKLVKNKEYFIITTNVDGHFEKSGFDKSKIFATQGDFIHLQCAKACHDKLYNSEELFREMVEKTKDRKIPTELLPKCPVCGGPMKYYLRDDEYFIEDDYWHQQCEAYSDFIKKNEDKKVLLLEFGVGFNTPTIIRLPFERRTTENKNWNLVRFNKDYSGITIESGHYLKIINDWDVIKTLKHRNNFQDRFIPFSEDVNEIIKELL